jgi:hypothetical protein
MVKITRDDVVVCRNCGATYEMVWSTPAKDTGSVDCQICDRKLIQWKDAPIPVILIKETAEGLAQRESY